ncbi:MAG: anaerobic ribonucleoside-triphosphate reductase activating protein [Clostridiaceae bacterium]|nr:anaerobic ribonucleoside-triphosphate reductase activating protein [Clostridiaceae bacterium]
MGQALRLAGTVAESIVDGPGIRYVIFTQGCPHCCPGCQNPETHDFTGGYEASPDALLEEIRRNRLVSGVTFSGGEPFAQAAALLPIAQALHEEGKHLMAYTGYTFEELLESREEAVQALLGTLTLLVDGRFELSQRSLELRFRGSANQRVLDVQRSLAQGTAAWAEGYQ